MDSSTEPVTNQPAPVGDGSSSGTSRKTSTSIAIVVALALVAGLIAWIVIDRSDSDSSSSTTPTATTPTTQGPAAIATPVGPVAVSATRLSALAASTGHLVYWAGPVAGQRYEFTRTSADNIYVRYLPNGVPAGTKSANYLVIATYPFPKAFAALKRTANGSEVKIPGGGIALVSTDYPQSVHFAFPGVAYQGEVYDPSPPEISHRGNLGRPPHPCPDRETVSGRSMKRLQGPLRDTEDVRGQGQLL